MKRLIKSALKRVGYEVRALTSEPDESPSYLLYNYRRADGSFDYERYRGIQESGNKAKLGLVWVLEENIAFLADYLLGRMSPAPKFGICHGTRRGKEQEWFRKYLPGCDVIGTEISSTASSFPNTIQWDFHEVKPEWRNAVDFIYSNSLDHSYDPERCLNAWMSCVKPGGICILEHSSLHEPEAVNELDPFGADLALMPYLVLTWGNGQYAVRQILKAPLHSDQVTHLHFLVIQRF